MEKEEIRRKVEEQIVEGIIKGLETAQKYTGVKIPAIKKLERQRAYITITILDIISWIFAAVCFIVPLFLLGYYELWIIGIAVLSTMIVRSIAVRLAIYIFLPIYFASMYLGGLLVSYIDLFNFIFFINTMSLVNIIVGVGIVTLVASWGLIGGLKGKRYRAGLGIVAFGLVLSFLDAVAAYLYFTPFDIYYALMVAGVHFLAYICAMIITWTIFYVLARVFVITVKSITFIQREVE